MRRRHHKLIPPTPQLTSLSTPLTGPWVTPANAGIARQESHGERGPPQEDHGLLSYGEKGKVQLQPGIACYVHTALLEPTPLQRTRHSRVLCLPTGRFGSMRPLCPGLGQGHTTSKCRSQDSPQVLSWQSQGHVQGPAGPLPV